MTHSFTNVHYFSTYILYICNNASTYICTYVQYSIDCLYNVVVVVVKNKWLSCYTTVFPHRQSDWPRSKCAVRRECRAAVSRLTTLPAIYNKYYTTTKCDHLYLLQSLFMQRQVGLVCISIVSKVSIMMGITEHVKRSKEVSRPTGLSVCTIVPNWRESG